MVLFYTLPIKLRYGFDRNQTRFLYFRIASDVIVNTLCRDCLKISQLNQSIRNAITSIFCLFRKRWCALTNREYLALGNNDILFNEALMFSSFPLLKN